MRSRVKATKSHQQQRPTLASKTKPSKIKKRTTALARHRRLSSTHPSTTYATTTSTFTQEKKVKTVVPAGVDAMDVAHAAALRFGVEADTLFDREGKVEDDSPAASASRYNHLNAHQQIVKCTTPVEHQALAQFKGSLSYEMDGVDPGSPHLNVADLSVKRPTSQDFNYDSCPPGVVRGNRHHPDFAQSKQPNLRKFSTWAPTGSSHHNQQRPHQQHKRASLNFTVPSTESGLENYQSGQDFDANLYAADPVLAETTSNTMNSNDQHAQTTPQSKSNNPMTTSQQRYSTFSSAFHASNIPFHLYTVPRNSYSQPSPSQTRLRREIIQYQRPIDLTRYSLQATNYWHRRFQIRYLATGRGHNAAQANREAAEMSQPQTPSRHDTIDQNKVNMTRAVDDLASRAKNTIEEGAKKWTSAVEKTNQTAADLTNKVETASKEIDNKRQKLTNEVESKRQEITDGVHKAQQQMGAARDVAGKTYEQVKATVSNARRDIEKTFNEGSPLPGPSTTTAKIEQPPSNTRGQDKM